jgi:hypothetical protein
MVFVVTMFFVLCDGVCGDGVYGAGSWFLWFLIDGVFGNGVFCEGVFGDCVFSSG